jgi:hypothetical protein
MFPNNDAVYQDDSPLVHSARNVQSCFGQHKDALQHLPRRPAQSPDILEPLWSVLESGVRNRFTNRNSTKKRAVPQLAP